MQSYRAIRLCPEFVAYREGLFEVFDRLRLIVGGMRQQAEPVQVGRFTLAILYLAADGQSLLVILTRFLGLALVLMKVGQVCERCCFILTAKKSGCQRRA